MVEILEKLGLEKPSKFTTEELIERHKNKINDSLRYLEDTVNICSRDTSRAAVSVMINLKNAIKAQAVHEAEEDAYERLIWNKIRQFEVGCRCSKYKD